MTTIKELDREKYLRDNPKVIYNFAYGFTKNPEDAQDITSEVSLKFLQTLEVFEYNIDPKNYIYRMIVNRCLDLKRAKARRLDLTSWEPVYDHIIEDINSIKPQVSPETEEGDLIFQALNQLSPKTRELINKRIFQEYSYEELQQLPEFQEKTISNIRAIVCRALQQVTKILAAEGTIFKPKRKRKPPKLSFEKVLEIRTKFPQKTRQELATEYSVSIQTIRAIINKKVRVND